MKILPIYSHAPTPHLIIEMEDSNFVTQTKYLVHQEDLENKHRAFTTLGTEATSRTAAMPHQI